MARKAGVKTKRPAPKPMHWKQRGAIARGAAQQKQTIFGATQKRKTFNQMMKDLQRKRSTH